MDALTFLETVSGYSQLVGQQTSPSANAPVRIATIDSNYLAYTYPGTWPKVTFDGEDALTDKRYPILGDYLPLPGARVIMIPVGHTYVIVGAINTPPEVSNESASATATVTTTTLAPTWVSLSGGPSISMDLRVGQRVKIIFQGEIQHSTTGAVGARCGIRVTGASGTREPVPDEGCEAGVANWAPFGKQIHYVASVGGSHTFELRYQAINGGTASFKNRRVFGESL